MEVPPDYAKFDAPAKAVGGRCVMDSRRIVVALATALLLIACSRVAKTQDPLADNWMAVEIYGGYMVVCQGSANGITNLRFLLDTGATDTEIDSSVADTLKLPTKATKITSFNKTVASRWAELREITFGPERVSNARVLIEDLSYFTRIGLHIDGVVGLDLLRRQSFTVNYAEKYVAFRRPATSGMRGAPILTDGELIKVQVQLDGHPAWMVVDTGAPAAVLYAETLKDLAVNYRLEAQMDWLSVSGHFQSHIARLPSFRVGGDDLGKRVILLSVPEAKRVNGVSGYLGVASLEAKEVAFDFLRNQLLWKK